MDQTTTTRSLADARANLLVSIIALSERGASLHEELRNLTTAYVTLGGDLELTKPEPPTPASDALLEPARALIEVVGRYHRDDFPGRLEDLVDPLNALTSAYIEAIG